MGILGGTFDPPHAGHARLAQVAQEHLALDKVLWIPNRVPVHKAAPQLSVKQRRQKLAAFIAQEPRWQLDVRELERAEPSYMRLTLESLHQDYPQADFWLLMGMDSLVSLTTWYQWPEILKLARLAVAPRPGYGVPKLDKRIEPRVDWLPMEPVNISSTQIRKEQGNGGLP